MLNKLKQLTAALTATLFFVFASACGNNTHPGQLNQFDGQAFDAFVAAHGALTSIRAEVIAQFPKYTVQFDQANATYATAYNTYVLFRQSPNANQAQLAIQINNVVASVVTLESLFESDMHASPAEINSARAKAAVIRAKVGAEAKSNISLVNILTELEIAATVAEAIPAASPYAAIAALVISATEKAVSDVSNTSGQPIDLSLITPVAQI